MFPNQLLFSLASSSFNEKLIRYADLVAACSQVEWSFHIPGGNRVPGFHWNIRTAAPENQKRALKDRGRAKELLVVASKELFTGSPSMRSKKIQARKPLFNRSNFTSVKTLQFALKLKTSTHVTLTNICLLWSRRWREEVRVSCSDIFSPTHQDVAHFSPTSHLFFAAEAKLNRTAPTLPPLLIARGVRRIPGDGSSWRNTRIILLLNCQLVRTFHHFTTSQRPFM